MSDKPLSDKDFTPRIMFTALDPVERSRTYIFTNGQRVTFHDVAKLAVSERGTHRLECGEGKVIVPNGWMAIIIDVDKWTL